MHARARRLAILLFAATLAMTPTLAAAQSTTADGIHALARGDHAAALRILRPLAEAPSPNPLAQFFLAALYDVGLGVGMDPLRACALYLKAASHASPLADQARARASEIRRTDPWTDSRCEAASTGIWGEPRPARFALGPDHSVDIDTTGLSVDYRGARHTVPTSWGGVEWVFLPTRYTRVTVSRPRPATRHFIEFFCWMPDDLLIPANWALFWTVYEVVGPMAHHVGDGTTVALAAGVRPPSSYRAETAARIQLNAAGGVDRVVAGYDPRTLPVPDPPDR